MDIWAEANDGTKLLVRQHNTEGEPLLLVNGLGSPLVSFTDDFVELFAAAGFAVCRMDNRDAGKSTTATNDYLLAHMASDCVAALDAVGWESAHVFGQSMGGMIVQQLAIDHPERVRSMVSLMSSTGEIRSSREAQATLMMPAPTTRDEFIAYRLKTEPVWSSPDHWNAAAVAEKAARIFDHGTTPEGTRRQYRAIVKSPSRVEALGSLGVPTTVIHGSADTLILPEAGRNTAEVIPDARYVEVDGLGHDLPPAFWELFVEETARLAGC